MLIRPAEDSFRKGLEALAAGRGLEALARFEAAVELERRFGVARPQARYLSYYGLCLGYEASRHDEGIRFCREALSLEFYNADLSWNLGRVLLLSGKRREAHDALQKGLAVQPGHAGILRELGRMGARRRPVVQFLSRSNPVNVLLGKLTYGEPAPRVGAR